jgi:hypothetical protein
MILSRGQALMILKPVELPPAVARAFIKDMKSARGTQDEFQFSMVLPHTTHLKLLISRASAMCSLRS